MNTLMYTASALVLAAAVSLSPALAAGPKASGGGFPPAAESVVPATTVGAPHYEWQYRYVGHHPRYEGHWVLVQ